MQILRTQCVLLLDVVQSTGATKEAGIEDVAINPKGLAAKQAVALEVFSDLACLSLLEAGQGDVRAELTVVWFQTKLKETSGDFALQEVERFAFLDAGPDDARLAAWGKEADPLQLQGKLRHRDLGQGLADVKEGGAVDFADETEGEVELFWWGPAGAR